VNGVDLSYVDQGTGAPVVFVHGSFSDFRIWELQRPAVAQSYHFIAYNERDHGPEPWPDAGQHYSAATHAADLAAFLDALQAGPVHLVAHSSGGVVATLVAIDHSDVVRSVTLAEPAIGTLLADLPEGKAPLDDRAQALAQVRAAVNAGDAVQATKVLFEVPPRLPFERVLPESDHGYSVVGLYHRLDARGCPRAPRDAGHP
jgi:pimeloyl-ACP methyl ester carboxylesterase